MLFTLKTFYFNNITSKLLNNLLYGSPFLSSKNKLLFSIYQQKKNKGTHLIIPFRYRITVGFYLSSLIPLEFILLKKSVLIPPVPIPPQFISVLYPGRGDRKFSRGYAIEEKKGGLAKPLRISGDQSLMVSSWPPEIKTLITSNVRRRGGGGREMYLPFVLFFLLQT